MGRWDHYCYYNLLVLLHVYSELRFRPFFYEFSSCNDNDRKLSDFKRALRPGRFALQQVPGQDQESK